MRSHSPKGLWAVERLSLVAGFLVHARVRQVKMSQRRAYVASRKETSRTKSKRRTKKVTSRETRETTARLGRIERAVVSNAKGGKNNA